jgi:autotransporter-associated beta strand protein
MSAKAWRNWLDQLSTALRSSRPSARHKARRRLLLEALESRLLPSTHIWTGAGKDGNWATAANWQGGTPNGGKDADGKYADLVFGALAPASQRTTDNTLLGSLIFNSITIATGASGYSISGNAFTLGSSTSSGASGYITVGVGSINNTISVQPGITLGNAPTSDQIFNIDTGASLTISSPLIGTTGSSLVKGLSGTLVLTADNSGFTGKVKLNQSGGIVQITNANALGTGPYMTVGANAQLQVSNVTGPINEPLLLNGPGIQNDGALLNVAGNNTWAGTIELDSDTTLGATHATGAPVSSLNITGQISDNAEGHNLTKEGTDQIIFSHAGGNTYRGLTTINSGILTIEDPQSLGRDLLHGGTAQSQALVNDSGGETGTLQLLDPNFASDGGGFTVRDEPLTLNGPGVYQAGQNLGALNNIEGDNNWAGTVNLATPTLIGISDSPVGVTLSSATESAAGAGTTVTITTAAPHPFLIGQVVNITGVNVAAYNGIFTITSVPTATTFTYTANHSRLVNATGGGASLSSLIISGVLSGSTLTKGGTRELILNNANTYTGGTVVQTGVLDVRDSQALGPVASAGATIVDYGASLDLEVDSGFDAHGRNLADDSVTGFNGNGPQLGMTFNVPLALFGVGYQDTGALRSLSGINIWTGNVSLENSSFFDYPAGFFVFGIAGSPTGATESGRTVTITTATPHNLSAGQRVQIAGVGVAGYNGLYTITSVPSSTTFTYIDAQPGLPLSGGGTATGFADVAIGVDPDPNPTADANYFTHDYKLTLTGVIDDFPHVTIPPPPDGVFDKVDLGQLILLGSSTYKTETDIQQGWITIGNANALGLPLFGLSDTAQPPVQVDSGAALHLIAAKASIASASVANGTVTITTTTAHPFLVGQLVEISGVADPGYDGTFQILSVPSPTTMTFTDAQAIGGPSGGGTAAGGYTLNRNLILAGTGITHPFGLISQKGALMNLSASNLLSGGIQLNNTVDTAAIAASPGGATEAGSTVTITTTAPHPFHVGDEVQVSGVGVTGYDGVYTITSVTSATTFTYTSSVTGLAGSGGGTAGLSTGIGVEQVFGPPPSQPSQLTTTGQISDFLDLNTGAYDPGSIIKLGSQRLIIQGDGTYSGSSEVAEGTLRIQNDTALGRGSSGTGNGSSPPGTEAFNVTPTAVNAGAALEMASGIADLNGGIAAGIQVYDEHLILNGPGQQVSVNGLSGTFMLTFNSQTTTALNILDPTLAADMQTALNMLSSISGVGGFVTVTQGTGALSNVYTVVFGGSLLESNNPLMTATTSAAPDDATIVISGTSSDTISGTPNTLNSPLLNVAGDNTWRGPVTLNVSSSIDVTPNSRLGLLGNIDDNPNPSASGSDIIKLDGGELALGGSNSYRGATHVGLSTAVGDPVNLPGGVLTVENSQALGQTTGGVSPIANAPNGAVASGSTVTITTSAALPLTAGQEVQIAGVGVAGYNGLFTITSVSSPSTFTYTATQGANIVSSPNGATESGSTATITTATPHGFSVGETVQIAGVGVAGFNGTYVITSVPSPTTFTYTPTQSASIASSPNGATESGSTVTITTAADHGFSVGQTVQIAGVGVAGYNGSFTITSVPSPTSFTYTAVQSGLAASGGGTAVATVTGLAASGGGTASLPASGGGTATANGGTLVANGGTLQVQGNITVAGEPLTVQGTGLGAAPTSIPVRWVNVGPGPINKGQTPGTEAVSGRVTGVAVDPTDPRVMYISTAGGGAWKSKNSGLTWTQMFDSASIQALSLPSGTGSFTLSFTYGGATATTAAIGFSFIGSTDPTLALRIQQALNALPTIGGLLPEAGSVTVTQSSVDPTLFNVIFGGALSGMNLPLLTATGLGSTSNPVVTGPTGSPGSTTGGYNGLFSITSAGGKTFTYTDGQTGLTPSGGGTAEVYIPIASATIAGASAVGQAVTITTSAPHNFVEGELVQISGVPDGDSDLGEGGPTDQEYNGTFTITSVPTPTTFTYTSGFGDRIVSAVEAPGGTLVTVTTQSGNNNFLAGEAIQILGVSVPGYNGLFTILTGGANTFTYILPPLLTGLAAGSGGTVGLPPTGGGTATAFAPGSTVNVASAPTGATEAGSTVTITTTVAHGFAAGDLVQVSGVGDVLPTAALYTGAIAVDPNNPRIIYLGTGEADNSSDSFYGTGVYMSQDSGQTWMLVTGTDGSNPLYGMAISKIVVDPGTPLAAPWTPKTANSTLLGTEPIQTPTGRIYVSTSDMVANAPTPTALSPELPGVYRFDTRVPDPIHPQAQVQAITVPTLLGSGTFKLTFDGATTGPLSFSSPTLASDIQTALDALSTIGAPIPPAVIAASPIGATATVPTVTITTTSPHGFAVGQTVIITGVGIAPYNGTFTITSVPSPTTFTYAAPQGADIASSPTGATESGSTATITTLTPHRFNVGDLVTIAGVGVADYNGTYVIASVPSATSFTYTPTLTATIAASPNGASEAGGTVTITTTAPHGFSVGETVVIAGVGVGGYNGTFVITSVLGPTMFQYTDTTTGLAMSGGGTATATITGLAASGGGTATMPASGGQSTGAGLAAVPTLGGLVTVTQSKVNPLIFNVSFEGRLLAEFSGPGTPGTNYPTDTNLPLNPDLMTATAGVLVTPASTWVNLTDATDYARATQIGALGYAPKTPGPKDDFRFSFPQGVNSSDKELNSPATWSDLSLVYLDATFPATGTAPSPGDDPGDGILTPVLFAALGTAAGSANNAVFRTEQPELAPESNFPTIWNVGAPAAVTDEVQSITVTNWADPAGSYQLELAADDTDAESTEPPTTGTDPDADNDTDTTPIFVASTDSVSLAAPPPLPTPALTLQTALNALPDVAQEARGRVLVNVVSETSTVLTFNVEWIGTMADTPFPLIEVVGKPTGTTTVAVAEVHKGAAIDTRAGDFPAGASGAAVNGNIKITTFVIPNPSGDPDDIPSGFDYPTYKELSVYAVVAAPSGGFQAVEQLQSSASAWGGVSGLPNPLGTHWYYDESIIAASAANVFVGGESQIFETTNSGGAWTDISKGSSSPFVGPHGNYHAMFVDSLGRLLVGNDGGVWRLDNTSTSSIVWTDVNGNLAITTFNGASADPNNYTLAVGGSQNNGVEYLSTTSTTPPANSTAWAQSLGNDGGQVHFNPQNSNIVYAVNDSGLLVAPGVLNRSTDGGQHWTNLSGALPALPPSPATNFPFAVDTVNPQRLLAGPDSLYESLDGGTSWHPIINSPSGVRALALATYQGNFVSDAAFPDAFDRGANTYDPNTIYITDGGNLYVTKDHGQNWLVRTPPSPPFDPKTIIQAIAVDPGNRDTIYMVTNSFVGSTGTSRVLMSTDAGLHWTDISSGLPDLPAWSIAVDPRTDSSFITGQATLYLGNDNGVWQLVPGGAWTRFGSGMPRVQVQDLELNQALNTLTAGTYGRSMFQYLLSALPPGTSAGIVGSLGGVSEAGSTVTVTTTGDHGLTAGQVVQIAGVAVAGYNGTFTIASVPSSTTFTYTDTQTGLLPSGGGSVTAIPLALIANSPTGATASGSTVTITTTAAHGFTAGQVVQVAGVGDAGYDGVFTVTSVTPTTFSYTAGQGASIASGPTGATEAGSTVTITTNTPHGFSVGETIQIAGAGVAAYNGIFTVTSVPSPTTFTYTDTQVASIANVLGGATEAGSTATITTSVPHVFAVGETVQIAGVDIAGYNGIFTITSVTPTTFTYTDVQTGLVASGGGTATVTVSGLAPSGGGVASLPPSGGGSADTRLYGAFRASSGSSQWTGTVQLVGDPNSNAVAIAAAGSQTVQNGITAAQLNIIGPISDLVPGSNPTLDKFGQGNVILSDANTYGGVTEIKEGVLTVNNAQALGDPTSPTIVDQGTSLQLETDLAQEPVQLNGDGFLFNNHYQGALRNLSGSNTFTGTITLNTDSTIGVDTGTFLTIGAKSSLPGNSVGTITSGGTSKSLFKESTGTLVFASANSYIGHTTVNQGALQVQNDQALSSTQTEVKIGAQLQLQTPPTQTVTVSGTTGTFSLSFNGQSTPAEPVSSTIASTPNGAAEAGSTVTITTTAPHGFTVGQMVQIAGVAVAGYNGTFAITSVPSPTTFTYTDTQTGLASSGGGTATLSAAQLQADLNALTTIGNVGGSVAVTLTGNAYTVAFQGSLGTAEQPPFVATTTGGATAVVTQGTGTPVVVTNEPLILSGTGIFDTGALLDTGGNNKWQGPISLADNPVYLVPTGLPALPPPPPPPRVDFGVSNPTDTLTINGVISQEASLTNPADNPLQLRKVGVGRLTFAQNTQNNTYPGVTTVYAGALRIQTDGTPLGTSPNPAVVDNGGVLELDGDPTTAGNFITLSQPVDLYGYGPAAMQSIALSGTTGTFQLSFNGSPLSGAIKFNSQTLVSDIQTALNNLPTIQNVGGSVTVTQTPDGYLVTFGGTLATSTVPLITSPSQLVLVSSLVAGGQGALRNVSGSNVFNGAISHQSSPVNYVIPIASLPNGATASGTTATITMTGPLPLATGQVVDVAGVGVPGYNGQFTITSVPSSTTFTYTLPQGANIASAPFGAIESGSTVTITTMTPHGFIPGQMIQIAGVGLAGYDGVFTVTSVPTLTTFTYTASQSGLANSGGGTASLAPSGTGTVTAPSTLIGTAIGVDPGLTLTAQDPSPTSIVNSPNGASEAGSTVTITTSAAHNFSVGQTVQISGVGVAGYNGLFTIGSIPSPTSFTYTPSLLADIAAAPGGAIEQGSTVTITTTAPHNFAVGQTVVISGVGNFGYDGTFPITAVNPTSFTYTDPTIGLGASGGGTAVVTLTGLANSGGGVATPLRTLSVASTSETGAVVTVTTNAVNGFFPGQTIRVSGVGGSYDGIFTIASVISDTTFTYLDPATGLGGSGGGTITPLTYVNPASLSKVGAGTLVFPAARTYTGATYVDNGALNIQAGTNAAVPASSALGGGIPEQQTITVLGNNGTFSLTFNGSTTSVLAVPANDPQFLSHLTTALQNLPTVQGAGAFVAVTQGLGSSSNVYTVTFLGSLQYTNVPQIVTNTVTGFPNVVVATVNDGPGGTVVNSGGTLQVQGGITVSNENLTLNGTGTAAQQLITPSAASGTITLSFTYGGTTATTASLDLSLPPTTLAADIQSDLNALSTIGGVGGSVTVSPIYSTASSSIVYVVVFGGSLATVPVPAMTATGQASVSVLIAGAQGALESVSGSNTWDSPVTLGSNALIGVDNTGVGNNLTIDQAISDNGAGYGVTKVGLGTLVYSGGVNTYGVLTSNTYTGTTAVQDGTLQLNKTTSASLTAGIATATETGTTVTITTTADHGFIPGQVVQITGVGVAGYNGLFTITSVPSLTSFTYTATQMGLANSTGGTATDLNLASAGAVTVGDSTGVTTSPDTDTLQLEQSNQLISTSAVSIVSDGLFDLRGQTQTIGSLNMAGGLVDLNGGTLTLAGNVTGSPDAAGNPAVIKDTVGTGSLSLGGATRTFTVSDPPTGNPDMTVSAVISGTTAMDGLTLAGNGTLQLTANETYTGTTTINGGDLQVDGTLSGPVSLTGGALNGMGTVGPITSGTPVAPSTASTLATGDGSPGFHTPGNLNVQGDVTLNAQTNFFFELGSDTPGELVVTGSGNVNLGGATLTGVVDSSYLSQATVGKSWEILSTTGSITSQFAQGGDGASIFLGTAKFLIIFGSRTGGKGTTLSTITLMREATNTTTSVAVTPASGLPSTVFTVTATVTPEPGASGLTPGTVDITVTGPNSFSQSFTPTVMFDPGTGLNTASATLQGLTGGVYTVASAMYVSSDPGINDSSAQAPLPTFTVNQAPAFTSASSATFTAGTLGSFMVTASGFPIPTLSEDPTDTLPSGVTFTAATGVLSGTPAAGTGGTYTLHFTAANGIGSNATQTFTLTVDEAPAFTSASNTGFAVGTPGSFTVTASGFPAPTLTEDPTDTLPSGVTFNAPSGVLSGTPAAGTMGIYTLHFTAANGIGSNATQTFTLTVGQPPAFTSPSSTTFTVGMLGSFTLTASGFPAPTFSEAAGDTLPGGVTFNAASATLSGTPAAGTGGTYTLHFTAANGVGSNATQTFTLTVDEAPAFTSASSTIFTVSQPGSFTVTASGFPAPTLSEDPTDTLPSGVTFNATTGVLSGTPAAGTIGNYTLHFTAANGIGSNATQTFTLTVGQPPAFTSPSSTTFTVGTLGSFTLTASGFPAPTFSEAAGDMLPGGVTFNAASATLSGTPAAGTGGTYTLHFTAANGVGSNATQTFTLTVNQAPAFTSANNTTFTVGTLGSFTLTASGFPAPTFIEAVGDTLPGGVTFNAASGTLSGTPAAGTGGTYTLHFTAANGVGSNATQTFTLTVDQAPAFTSANNAAFTVGTLGSFTLTASGFPAPTFSEAAGDMLPGGVTFNATSGTLSGTPAAGTGGTYTLHFTATNGVGSNATQTFTLTVDQAPAFTSVNNATFTVGAPGTFTVTASGFPAPTLSEAAGDTLPGGVTFNAASGTLNGTPAAGMGGTYTLHFTAANGIGNNATQTFTLTVDQAPAFTSANKATFPVGTLGSFTLTASGFPAPTFSEAAGDTLPGGVTFNAATGILSGTPAAGSEGNYMLHFTAANGVGSNATQTFTLTVGQPPAFTSASSTTFTAGTPGSFTVTTSGFPAPTITEIGTLPTGVHFDPSTDVLSGTPAAGTGGIYGLTFTANNGVGTPASQSFTLTIDQAPAITSAASATFFIGEQASITVTASGFPAPTISESGPLPAGVTFDPSTGVLGGTPATGTAGNYNLTFTASNGVGSNFVQPFTLTVLFGVGHISGTVFQDYNLNGVQDGGEPSLAGQEVFLDVTGSGLPTGNPTAITDANGNYLFTVQSAGPFTVRQLLYGGVLLSTPGTDSYQVTAISGATVSGLNFADVPTSITVPLTLPPNSPFPAQGNANADWVEGVYRAVLNRDADAAGLADWTGKLNSGAQTRVQVVQGIRNSPEHFAQEIEAFYITLLGRTADPAGLAHWVGQLQSGVREEQIAFDFLDSPEYLGKGDKFFVDSMYLSLLGRSFDAAGEASWLAQLGDDPSGNQVGQATLTHEQVIRDFLFSTESLTRLTQGYYQVFLQRPADTAGVNSWVNQLLLGQPFLTIGEDFLASDEFFARAAAHG